MKFALLTASLATAAVAAAAELKDSTVVAQEWQKAVAQVPAIAAVNPRLRDQVQTPPIFPERTYPEVPLWKPEIEPSPFESAIRPPDYDPKRLPKGAKPYRFNDETYWLIPLTT